jgi:hypothetical protein
MRDEITREVPQHPFFRLPFLICEPRDFVRVWSFFDDLIGKSVGWIKGALGFV